MKNMCSKCREMMDAYIDDVLTKDEIEEFEIHIAKCEECRNELNDMLYIISLAKEMEDEPVPSSLRNNIMRTIRIEENAKKGVKKKRIKRRIYSSASLVAAALVVLVFVYYQLDDLIFTKDNMMKMDESISEEDTLEEPFGSNGGESESFIEDDSEKGNQKEIATKSMNVEKSEDNRAMNNDAEKSDDFADGNESCECEIMMQDNSAAFVLDYSNYQSVKLKINKTDIDRFERLLLSIEQNYEMELEDKYYYDENKAITTEDTMASVTYIYKVDVNMINDVICKIMPRDQEDGIAIPIEGKRADESVIELTVEVLAE